MPEQNHSPFDKDPMKRERQGDRFDPSKELGDSEWSEVSETLRRLFNGNSYPVFFEMAAHAKLLAPERDVAQLDQGEMERLIGYIEKGIAHNEASWLKNVKIAFPEVFSQLKDKVPFEQFKEGIQFRQRTLRGGHEPISGSKPEDLRVLFPDRSDVEIGFNELVRKSDLTWLTGLRAEAEADEFPNWDLVARKAAEMRILDPQNIEALHIDQVFCKAIRDEVDNYIRGKYKGKDWQRLVEILANLRILFAKSVTVTERGIEFDTHVTPKKKAFGAQKAKAHSAFTA